jgi:hypothetical protein
VLNVIGVEILQLGSDALIVLVVVGHESVVRYTLL